MTQLVLLRGARQLLTLRGPSGVRRGAALHDLGIVEDGSVLINGGIIAAVGSTRRIENLKEARHALEIPVDGKVVMPGFIDPGINVDLKIEPGFSQPSVKRKAMAEFSDRGLALLRSCLQHGTLTAEIKTGIDTSEFQSNIALLRHLAKLGSNPVAMVRTWRLNGFPDTDEASVSRFRETLTRLAREKLAHFVELPLSPYEPGSEQIWKAVEECGLGMKLLWRNPASPNALRDDSSSEMLANLLSRFHPRTLACPTCLGSAECSELSKTPTIAVFAPVRDLFEGPAAPERQRGEFIASSARKLADAGAGIAICTEYNLTLPASWSMQTAISSAVMCLKLTPEEAITAATINAAHACACGHITGSLESGKRADVLVLSTPDYREICRQFGVNHVDIAIRNGTIAFNRTRWKVSAR